MIIISFRTILLLMLATSLCGCADGKSKKVPPCGNGVLDPNEQCDDFNRLPDDGCSVTCVLEEGWDCGDTLPTVCTPICGDGRVVGLEPCDDGALEAGDGCGATCTVETGWTCEAMPSVCITTCGDGLRADGVEACDDGNLSTGDGCDATCTVETGWTCQGDAPSSCGATECGDGIAAGLEPCDGWDVPGQDCQSQGFDSGTLLCAPDCTFDTSDCQLCGDGTCDEGEICAQDCGATWLSVGFAHACVLMTGGRAWCWGYNHAGQLGNGRVGAEACFFDIPCDSSPQEVLGAEDLMFIHAGFSTTCAIKETGGLSCWGSNQYGQLGDGQADHGILCGTSDCSLVPTSVHLTLPMIASTVSSGYYHSCALGMLGEVACWGSNQSGQLGDGVATHETCEGEDCSRTPVAVSILSNVQQISAAGQFTCALRANGTVWCWGANDNGQLGNGTTTASNIPVQVSGLTGVSQISAGGNNFACAVRGDYSVWCWGANADGQLGDGSTTDRHTPVQVGSLSATSVSCGSNHVCARRADLATWCWGGNSAGQLGTGTTVSSPVPVQISLPLEDGSVGAGGWYFTCAHSTLSGVVGCWGNNSLGQLGQGNLTESLVPVIVPGLTP
ncbi:DUF4215 domain-containing protein [Myxococcota bacterium]|nr:DUF4215 domain-containing protein [Myxococcota bacterium]